MSKQDAIINITLTTQGAIPYYALGAQINLP